MYGYCDSFYIHIQNNYNQSKPMHRNTDPQKVMLNNQRILKTPCTRSLFCSNQLVRRWKCARAQQQKKKKADVRAFVDSFRDHRIRKWERDKRGFFAHLSLYSRARAAKISSVIRARAFSHTYLWYTEVNNIHASMTSKSYSIFFSSF